ncbi:hypothetical protein HOD08_05125, partial [bacterium]|nr:hypothetical protein [bacterium]
SLQRERAVRQKAKAAKAAALSSTPAVTSSSAVQAVPSVPPVAPVVAVTSTQTETKKTANIETQISEEELKKEALAKKLAAFNLKNPKHSAEEIKTTHEAPCATNNELAEDITKKARAKESPDFLSFTTEATLSDEKKLEVLKKVTPVRFTDRDKTFLLNKKSEFIKKLVETKRKLEQKQDEITEIESKEQSQGMLKAGWQAFKGFAGYNKNANQLKKLKSETKTLSELIEKENERVEEVVKLFQPATAKLSVVNMLGEHVKLLNGTRAPEVKATPICNYEQTQGKVLLQQQKYATEKREAAEAAKAQEAKAITKAETAKAAKAKHWKRVGIAHAIGGGVAIAGLTAELGLGYASYKKSGGKLGFFKFVKNHFAGLKKAIASGNFKALAKIYPATVATILTATVDAAYWIGYEGIYKSGFSKLYNKTAPKVTDAATYVKDKTVNGYDWCHEKITHQKANAAAAADDALNLGFRDVFAPKTSITVITPKAEVPAAPKGILKKNTTEKAQRETAKNVTFKSTESQENKQQPEVATTTQAG